MKVSNYINRELFLISPFYFCVFDNRIERWRIRKWKSIHPISHKLSNWEFISDPIMTVKYMDDQGNDIGYRPIAMDAVEVVRKGLYWARQAKKLARMIDDSNDDMVTKALKEDEYQAHFMAKNIWHKYQEPTVILGS